MSNDKKKIILSVPPEFEQYIKDPKVQKAFVKFASRVKNTKKIPMVSKGELTKYGHVYYTELNGEVENPDDIAIRTYKLMRKDAQIQLGLKVLKAPVKAMKWWVESTDKDVAAFVEFALKRVWKSMMSVILTALDFGCSVSEKVWEVKDIVVTRKEKGKDFVVWKGQAVLLKKLKNPDIETVNILTDNNGDFNGFKQTYQHNPVTVPAEKSFVFTNEKEFGNLYGKSRLRYVYDYWYWSVLMYQFLNRYMERRGTPPTKARAPKGKQTLENGNVVDNIVLGQQMGESLTESSTVCLPSTIDEKGNYVWDVEYMSDDQRSDMFISYIEHLNTMKLRGLFVPERAIIQDTDMGARAVAKTHLNVFLLGIEGFIEDIIDHINRYIIPQLIEYNFGKDAAPAYIKTRGMSMEVRNLLKQILITAMKQGAGVPIDMMKALEDLELPVTHDPERMPPKPEDNQKTDDNNIQEGDKDVKAEKSIDDLREKYRIQSIRELLEQS